MKLFSVAKLLQPKEDQPPRREPRLELYRDPFAGRGPCERAQSVPAALRVAVTDSCPRCGAAPNGGFNGRSNTKAACILQSLDLDLRVLDEERTTEALRDVIGRLEPRLV